MKAKGGTTIAQSPATAAHAGMPQAARATGCVDVTLPLEEIGPAVVSGQQSGVDRGATSLP